MTNKTNLRLDNIKKGIFINRNKEVDYIANIIIQSDTNTPYEYAIIESGEEDSTFIPFTLGKGTLAITHKNTDGVHKKMVLLLKSEEPIDVEVKIDIERYYNYNGDGLETLGPRGQVLLNSSSGTSVSTERQSNPAVKKIWYKDPWIIGGAVLVLILIVIFMMASRKQKNSGTLFSEM